MLPWLPYVHCTILNPSSGLLALNGEKSRLLESSAEPFPRLAALSSGVLRLPYNCGRSRIAARSCAVPEAATPTQCHPFHPKLGCKRQTRESRGGRKGPSLNPVKYSGFGLACSGLVQRAEFLLASKTIECNIKKEQFGGPRTCLMAAQIPDKSNNIGCLGECLISTPNMLQNIAQEPPESHQLIIKLLTIITLREEGNYFLSQIVLQY